MGSAKEPRVIWRVGVLERFGWIISRYRVLPDSPTGTRSGRNKVELLCLTEQLPPGLEGHLAWT